MTATDGKASTTLYTLRISDLSRLTGVPVSTLRFWCDERLLSPYVTASGHRLFDEGHVTRAQTIQRLRKVQGLSIAAVRSTLSASTPLGQTSPQTPSGTENTVGQRLRQMRLNARLTLREVSRATELAPSVLASIERTSLGFGIPEAKVLAKYFGTTLTALMAPDPGQAANDVVTTVSGGTLQPTLGSGLRIEQLATGRDMMDCQRWFIEPGIGSHGAYDHEGEEFIYVLMGRFSIIIEGKEPILLTQGESIYFRSNLRHSWQNPGQTTTVLLWVNTPPSF